MSKAVCRWKRISVARILSCLTLTLPLLEEEAADDAEGEEDDGQADAAWGIVVL